MELDSSAPFDRTKNLEIKFLSSHLKSRDVAAKNTRVFLEQAPYKTPNNP